MFNLPTDNRRTVPVPLHDPGRELDGSVEQHGMGRHLDQSSLFEWPPQAVRRREELGVSECLERPDADDDLLTGSFRGLDLPVELARAERSRLGLDPIPVGLVEDAGKTIKEARLSAKAQRFLLFWARRWAQAGVNDAKKSRGTSGRASSFSVGTDDVGKGPTYRGSQAGTS
jgi:hypothetical protein